MKLKIIFKILSPLVLVYLLLVMVAYGIQDRLVYLGTTLDPSYSYSFKNLEKEVFLTHSNGDSINALYFKTGLESKGVVLYFHGNAGNLSRWGSIAEDFTTRGYDVFIIDYRSYGKSTGKASEKHLKEDGQIAFEWLTKRYSKNQIILYGRSLGSGVASYLAAKEKARFLILESPFASIPDVAQLRFPYIWKPFGLKNQFSNLEELPKVQMPIYIFHGTQDQVVPFKSAIKLKKKLKETDRFTILEGIGHHHINRTAIYREQMNELL